MNLEFAYIRETVEDCESRIAASKAWLAMMDNALGHLPTKERKFDGWDGPLLPYRAFHEFYSKGLEWNEREAFVVPRSLHERFRIAIERSSAPDTTLGRARYFDCGRDETLAEHGIDCSEEDAADFADRLWECLFMYTSPNEMRAVAAKLQAYLAEFDAFCEARA
jgi:hypothetical protein